MVSKAAMEARMARHGSREEEVRALNNSIKVHEEGTRLLRERLSESYGRFGRAEMFREFMDAMRRRVDRMVSKAREGAILASCGAVDERIGALYDSMDIMLERTNLANKILLEQTKEDEAIRRYRDSHENEFADQVHSFNVTQVKGPINVTRILDHLGKVINEPGLDLSDGPDDSFFPVRQKEYSSGEEGVCPAVVDPEQLDASPPQSGKLCEDE